MSDIVERPLIETLLALLEDNELLRRAYGQSPHFHGAVHAAIETANQGGGDRAVLAMLLDGFQVCDADRRALHEHVVALLETRPAPASIVLRPATDISIHQSPTKESNP